ncbi:unnamed protein product [Brachionus calyciflorus]|uniref:Uncharacterized protein n=1 Tax=Brachionus calyciflorus TaxID=104777 RepID=A0A814R843_9BILA|nr:unnamed protein product [Brachionus calyciflorus]
MDFPKNNDEFYKIKNNPEQLIEFIKQNELYNKKIECNNHLCSRNPSNFKLSFVKKRLVLRCMNHRCRRYFSARSPVFNLSKKSNLNMEQIIELIWYWSQDHSVRYTSEQTGVNEKSIGKWFNKMRQILYQKMLKAPPMRGEKYSVQIDESLFQGKRKYNRGRFLKSDKKTEESSNPGSKNRNYGSRISGP